jgi:hypothetical protein
VRWQKAIGKRLKKLRVDRPELGDDVDRTALACLVTAGAVFELSGRDHWVSAWALMLIVRDSQAALDRDDVAAAMASSCVKPDVLLKRARDTWPPKADKRAITAIERWDKKDLAKPDPRRHGMLWSEPRIKIPHVPPRGTEQT